MAAYNRVLGAVSALGDKVSTMFADADEGW